MFLSSVSRSFILGNVVGRANEVSGTRSRLTQVAGMETVSKALLNRFSLIWPYYIMTSLVNIFQECESNQPSNSTLIMFSSSFPKHYISNSWKRKGGTRHRTMALGENRGSSPPNVQKCKCQTLQTFNTDDVIWVWLFLPQSGQDPRHT